MASGCVLNTINRFMFNLLNYYCSLNTIDWSFGKTTTIIVPNNLTRPIQITIK